MNPINAFERLIARWLSRQFGKDHLRIQRALLLFYMTASVVALCSAFLFYFSYYDLSYGLLTSYVGLAFAAGELFILLVLRRVVVAGHFFCACVLAFFLISIYYTTGVFSPYVPWLILAPVTASLLFDFKATIFWSIMAALCYITIVQLHPDGLGDPSQFFAKKAEIHLFASAGFFSYTLVLIVFAERARFDLLRLQRLIHSDQERQQSSLLQAIQGRELERQRISRELHDGVNAHLTALHLQQQSLLRHLPKETPLARNIVSQIDELSTKVSGMSRRLSIHVLRDFGLEEGIRHLTTQTEVPPHNETRIFVDHQNNVPGDMHIPVYRMVQEIMRLTSQMDNMEIQLQVLGLPEMLRLMVEGNPVSEQNAQMNYVLRANMPEVRDHTNVLNGEILLETDPQGGFSLIIEIPMDNEKNQTYSRG